MIKKIKNKYLLFLAFLVVLLFGDAGFVHAALEVTYPSIPLLAPNPPTASSTLPQYIAYWFGLLIGVAGILALISFTVGAVQLIASFDSAEAASNAKDRMKGSVLGLVLTLASFIIMQTINPNLVSLTLVPPPAQTISNLPPQPGVYFYLDSNCVGQDSMGNNNALGPIPSQDDLGSVFDGNVRSVKIINDYTNGIYYGVILHEAMGLQNGGKCTPPIIPVGCLPPNGCCQTINTIAASAVDIFTVNTTPTTSGTGIAFYSEPYGWDAGQNAAFANIAANQIKSTPSPIANDGTTLSYASSYAKIQRPTPYQADCPDFWTCPGSIEIKGNYLVALYSSGGGTVGKACDGSDPSGCRGSVCCSGAETCSGGKCTNAGGSSYCQTFIPKAKSKGVENLKAQPVVAAGGGALTNIYIIPTKSQ